jgi:hypothetical protein
MYSLEDLMMMVERFVVGVLVIVGLTFSGRAGAADLRAAVGRPELLEVGNPILISRETLAREMGRNQELSTYVTLYGWPDYAEVQETVVNEPVAPYEVRLYYLRRNQQVAYSRVYVSRWIHDFGIRRYMGPIPEETLARLLTAQGEIMPGKVPAPEVGVEAEPAKAHAGPEDGISAALLRMEAAADRAMLAAEMAERASAAANASATRANAVLDKMLVR